MDPAEFEDCLRRARRGHREALDCALDAIRERLHSAARRGLTGRLRQHMETADILQTTYLDIVRGIEGFRGADQESFAAWVGTVLAYYFFKDNFKAASKSVQDMAKIATDEKLKALFVRDEMISFRSMA